MQYYLRGEIIMKCQFCNVEMVYKPNMRGLYGPGMDHNMNALIVNYTEEVEEDCLIFKIFTGLCDELTEINKLADKMVNVGE